MKSIYKINNYCSKKSGMSFVASVLFSAQVLGQTTLLDEANTQATVIPLHGAHPQIITTTDDYKLGANYFLGDRKNASVLILHDCAHNSVSYSTLGTKLSEIGLNALALDFRGYGASSSDNFSHETLKKEASNIVEYQHQVAALSSYWESDVVTAYNYLLKQVDNKKGISLVAIGCAASYAVTLAEKMHVNAMVFVTPSMSYSDKERYKNLIDAPTYFINSSHHIETLNTAKELFDWNGSKYSKMQIFKSDDYDYGLLRRNQYLLDDISSWLKFVSN